MTGFVSNGSDELRAAIAVALSRDSTAHSVPLLSVINKNGRGGSRQARCGRDAECASGLGGLRPRFASREAHGLQSVDGVLTIVEDVPFDVFILQLSPGDRSEVRKDVCAGTFDDSLKIGFGRVLRSRQAEIKVTGGIGIASQRTTVRSARANGGLGRRGKEERADGDNGKARNGQKALECSFHVFYLLRFVDGLTFHRHL